MTSQGTLQRAIGEPQSAFEQGTGMEGTIHLEEFYLQKNIRMVDTRGFFDSDERLLEECLKIMSGRYIIRRLRYLCWSEVERCPTKEKVY